MKRKMTEREVGRRVALGVWLVGIVATGLFVLLIGLTEGWHMWPLAVKICGGLFFGVGLFVLLMTLPYASQEPPIVPGLFGVTVAEKQYHLARWRAGVMTHKEAYDYERSQGW